MTYPDQLREQLNIHLSQMKVEEYGLISKSETVDAILALFQSIITASKPEKRAVDAAAWCYGNMLAVANDKFNAAIDQFEKNLQRNLGGKAE